MSEMRLLYQNPHPLGESALWHVATRRFMWVDLYQPEIFDMDIGSMKVRRRALNLIAPIGSMVATSDPDVMLICHRNGLSLLNLTTLKHCDYCNPEQGRDAIIFNDMKVDRWGRLWVGTSHEKEMQPRGALWCVKDKHTWSLADAGFPVSNGPAFSVDGTTMYFNDSVGRQTFVYDINADDLKARNRRVLKSCTVDEGMPDGVTVDASGAIWNAQWAGAALVRLSPEGAVLARHHVPSGHVTSLCFGGDEMKTIFITTARDGLDQATLEKYPHSGSLFAMQADTPGIAEPLFAI